MNDVIQDIRYALRMMWRSPGVTVVAVLAIALGVGANSSIFSAVNSVLLRPLPYKDPDRLVQIWGQMPSRGIPIHFVPFADFFEWRERCGAFESMSAYRPASMNLTGRGEPQRLSCLWVNADFFRMIGVPLMHGRGFLPEDDLPGADRVAVLKHSLWQTSFGSDPGLVGQTIVLDGQNCTVVGILPRGFQFGGRDTSLYVPLAASGSRDPRNPGPSVGAFARLKAGVSLAQAQAEMETISRSLDERFPGGVSRGVRVWGLREFMVRNVRLSLLILMGAVGLVLLIACANVANILLARAGVRKKEIAVRAALGANRWRLAKQMLTESLILSLAGGILGAVLAYWSITYIAGTYSADIPLLENAGLDATVLGFTLLATLLTGVIFGMAPAFATSRYGASASLRESLKEGGHEAGAGGSGNRLRSVLVIAEVALSMMLLIAGGLLIRSFLQLQQINPGFNPKGVLTASITLPADKYPTGPRRIDFFQEFLEVLARKPEVKAAGIVNALPLSGSNTGIGISVEGRPVLRRGEAPIVWLRMVSEEYFRAMSIPLVSGRNFTARDNLEVPPVAVINQTMASRLWPGENPLGKRFSSGEPSGNEPVRWITVVGTVGDVRHMELVREPDAELYLPYRQMAPAGMSVAIRTDLEPMHLATLLRRAVASVDSHQPISNLRSMDQLMSTSISSRRLTMFLLAAFAAVALVLAAVGIYGVISYSVTRRTHEIGIRLALGARGGHVLKMVLGRALLLVAIGEILGLAAAFALRRVIGTQLYVVSSTDPLIFTLVPAALTVTAILAGLIPALRALRVDPLIALRHE